VAPFRSLARRMMVKATMPVRMINLVAPLPHEGTAMHTTETAGSAPEGSGAVSCLGNRAGDIDSATGTPGTRTSTTATRTTTTPTTSSGRVPSADDHAPVAEFSFSDLVAAYLDCRRTKRNSLSALAFERALAASRDWKERSGYQQRITATNRLQRAAERARNAPSLMALVAGAAPLPRRRKESD